MIWIHCPSKKGETNNLTTPRVPTNYSLEAAWPCRHCRFVGTEEFWHCSLAAAQPPVALLEMCSGIQWSAGSGSFLLNSSNILKQKAGWSLLASGQSRGKLVKGAKELWRLLLLLVSSCSLQILSETLRSYWGWILEQDLLFECVQSIWLWFDFWAAFKRRTKGTSNK